ncbi:hypothetical protein [Sphingomonas profundi]|uniref:hypothetical protein n=1 Tax=Alterirhizorhabdus profundi TaxID=2681549 RepID=UPI0012E8AD7D|nr:hypothetical protein [Sphingomonas profundi]
MKHDPIRAHAPNCACPRCRHLRRVELRQLRAEHTSTGFCLFVALAGFILFPGRVAVGAAARALGW